MTKNRRTIAFSILCLLVLCQTVYAQMGGITKTDWLKEMKASEDNITAYVDAHMQDSLLKQQALAGMDFPEISTADMPAFTEKYLRGYFRKKYLELHPEAPGIYNPGRIGQETNPQQEQNKLGPPPVNILCDNGDFETGPGSYMGYEDPSNYYGGLCSYVPFTNVAYTNVGVISNPDYFLLTNPGWDLVLPPGVLSQTHNGSLHAMRINAPLPCTTSCGMNMLQRTFYSPVSGKVKINFSYALVMEDPGHGSRNPFFVARVLNSSGVEVGTRICKIADAGDPFFYTYNAYRPDCDERGLVVFSDWTCDFITFNMHANETYTLEFFASDCGEGGHFGYAYVDDICADLSCCPPPPVNVKCDVVDEGNKISWDPVPGAVRYQMVIHNNDPSCCKNDQYQFMAVWDVYGTDTVVPKTFTTCFSYTVNTVCKDSTVSESLKKYCSCAPECPAPVNLRCTVADNNSKISWDPVYGAQGYQVIIYNNDPFCCSSGTLPFMAVWNVAGTDTTVPAAFSSCFSWTVNTICAEGLISQSLDKKCSCTPACPVPANWDCKQVANGSKLSWSPVSGAIKYEVVIYHNDPFCCPKGPLTSMSVWQVYGTDTTVPVTFAPCFSWYVNTVCADGTKSQTLDKQCSCSPSSGNKPGAGADKETGVPEGNLSVTTDPNPASDYIIFTVHTTDHQPGSGNATLHLYDVNGREIVKTAISYNSPARVNVQPYASGMYLYEIKHEGKTVYRGKVLIEKH